MPRDIISRNPDQQLVVVTDDLEAGLKVDAQKLPEEDSPLELINKFKAEDEKPDAKLLDSSCQSPERNLDQMDPKANIPVRIPLQK